MLNSCNAQRRPSQPRWLKKEKAPGQDGIQNELLLAAPTLLAGALEKLFAACWEGEAFPPSLFSAVIQPIFGKILERVLLT